MDIECDIPELEGGNGFSLQGIRCRFQSGEFAVVTGPGAAGKSLLARLVAGVERPRRGTVATKGRVWLVDQELRHAFVATRLSDELRGLRGLVEGFSATAPEALAFAGLAGADCDFDQVSHSQRRLLAVYLAAAARPDFLVLDEPFAGLDRADTVKIIRLLLAEREKGHGVIVACHDIERILAHADRLVLMKQGRVIADALPERVLPFLETHGVRKPNLKLAEMTWLEG